jgi:hypothetical protein
MDIKVDCSVLPWVEGDELKVDVSFNDVDWYTESIPLTRLFGEFVDSHKVYGTGEIRIEDKKNIMNVIATLRYIAREMETELEGARL